MSKNHYVVDAPLDSREADRLRRWPFAERIADTLATRSDPTSLVVGVYGRWGEGKTTVLRFIEQRLEEEHADSVVFVRFNPWLFTNDTELFVGFFAQVAAALDRKLATKAERLGSVLKKYGGLVSGISWAWGDLKAGAGNAIAGLGDELAKVTPEELRSRLEQGLAEEGKRVVVLLDDIDRLDKNEAQAVFRLLKVAADFRWTSYVLAFDREVIAAALAERYPQRPDGGDEFLDKIVQVPLPLPPAPREVLRKLLLDDISRVLTDAGVELSDREVHRFVVSFDVALLHRVGTPRSAKRYVNSLQFALPLLRGEVDTVDLLLIEALRIFRPALHAAIVRNREIILYGSKRRSKETIEAFKAEIEAIVGAGEKAWQEIGVLEELFPPLKNIYSNTFFGDESARRWAEQKRIASDRYFARYFSSGVPAGDLSDSEIRELLATAARDPERAATQLEAMLAQAGAERLAQKLIDAAWDAEGSRALGLADALLRVGMAFPNPQGAFAEFWEPRGRVAFLVARLLRHVRPPRASGLADRLGHAAVPFALQVLRRLHPEESEGEESTSSDSLTKAEWAELGSLLLMRVREEAEEQWPYDLGVEEGAFRLSLWRRVGDRGELRAYVDRKVKEHPTRALDLVRLFSAGGRDVPSGERVQDPLRPDGYELLKSLFPPSLLAEALEAVYGSALPGAGERHRHVASDAELAHSFLRLYDAEQVAADELDPPQGASE